MENTENTTTKKFYKRWWFIALVILIFFLLIGSLSDPAPNENQTKDVATTEQTSNDTTPDEEEPVVPREYKSALNKASSYATTMHMSKEGVYQQLISEYGEKFTPEAAKYAIDNVVADWNTNALVKAKNYQETMSMSPAAIHDHSKSR
jgi:Host cell surface-exposed lipoprotein